MIVGIEGIVEQKEPTNVLINLSGLIYKVHISINTSNQIRDRRVKLLVTQIIREDAIILFGFMDISE